jgi:prepilin-type processing-associated H-X9-DG protein
VIGIIALLVATLLPVVGNVRKVARSTSCLANLQQWGVAFQGYLSSNHGRPPADADDYLTNRQWWTWLLPHDGNNLSALLCPEALDPPANPPTGKNFKKGSATTAWAYQGGAEIVIGSYGFNHWIYQPDHPKNQNPYIVFPPKDAGRTPVLGDCAIPYVLPFETEPVPRNLIDPEYTGLASYCIDRHRRAVNIAFLDGHAEHVPLAELWKLQWSQFWTPRDVVIPE